MPKKKTRRSAKRRSNPPRSYKAPKRRYRRRRNPQGVSMNAITKQVMQGVVDAGYGVGGKAVAKAVSGMLGFGGGGITSYLVQAAIGVGGGMLISGYSKEGARAFVQGAFMAPVEELAVAANVPLLSANLAGYNNDVLPTMYNAGLLSPGPAVGMMGGYPGAGVEGYPPQFGDFDTMAETYGR